MATAVTAMFKGLSLHRWTRLLSTCVVQAAECGQNYKGTTMRADRSGEHRRAFEKNKQRILKTQDVCGICGRPIDKELKYPHPLAASVDHIIPVSRGGHPSDIENLQIAHWTCNRQKSDKMMRAVDVKEKEKEDDGSTPVDDLPQHINWLQYAVSAGRR